MVGRARRARRRARSEIPIFRESETPEPDSRNPDFSDSRGGIAAQRYNARPVRGAMRATRPGGLAS